MYTFYSVISDKPYLPPEIIELIYSFIITEYYANIINRFCINYIKIRNSIKTVIEMCLDNNLTALLDTENISTLQFLVNSHISRKYNLNVWANILHVLSLKINRLRFQYRCDNGSLWSLNGKKFKLVLDLWLQLCKKFNFKIFLQTKKFKKYIRAKHILKMNLYDKYLSSPIIIQPFTDTNWILFDEARQFLWDAALVI